MFSIKLGRRAQIGKLISLVPIMILIFIIMGVFVLLSAGYSQTNKPGVFDVESIAKVPRGDLLDKEVDLGGKQESIRKELIDFGEKYKFGNPDDNLNREGFDSLKRGLMNFLTNDASSSLRGEGTCLVIYGWIKETFSSKNVNVVYLPLVTKDNGDGTFVIVIRTTALGVVADHPDTRKYVEKLTPLNIPTTEFDSYNVHYYHGGCLGVFS